MAFIGWDSAFSVGVKRFDEEHQKLFGYVNKLHIGLVSSDSLSEMGKLLDGLIEYTVNHFAHEEQLMTENGYPDLAAHKTEHGELVKKVSEFKSRYEQGKASFSLELMSFLKDWLLYHIRGTDMKYKSYFNAKGIT
jgi:hemerythrin-like metal-binding protein